MRGAALMLCVLMLLSSCDQLKGPKGDTGATGSTGATGPGGAATLLSTKIYTGTTSANPHTVTCPEITNTNNQVINIFMVLSDHSTVVELPFTGSSWVHYYLRNTSSTIIALATSASPIPGTALYDSAWGQSSYRIEIRTFATAAAAQAYKAQSRSGLSESPASRLIYGAEVH